MFILPPASVALLFSLSLLSLALPLLSHTISRPFHPYVSSLAGSQHGLTAFRFVSVFLRPPNRHPILDSLSLLILWFFFTIFEAEVGVLCAYITKRSNIFLLTVFNICLPYQRAIKTLSAWKRA